MQERLQFSNPEAPIQLPDPPLTVALLCGGPLSGQAQSLASAQTFLQQLQTHNPREGFQGDPHASSSSLAQDLAKGLDDLGEAMIEPDMSSRSDSPLTISLPSAKRKDLKGINIVPIFISSEYRAMPITPAELCGKTAATLEYEAGLKSSEFEGLRRRQIVSLSKLAANMQDSQFADLTLSTVRGSGAGPIQAALQAAGLPVVGPSAHVHDITTHNFR